MGLSNVTTLLASSCPPSARPATSPSMPPPQAATILRHCRCMDCLNFSQNAGMYVCSAGVGGTSVVWGTGERVCEPAPDAWHYCARYRGPQISKDIWVWPHQAAHVGPRSNISGEVQG